MTGATINDETKEGVTEFICLGMLIGNDNSMEKEIQRPIFTGNRTCFAAISLFRRRILSRATKIILYKTLIRPVVSYGAVVWTLTKKEQEDLLIFERKIFRRIYGPKYENRERKSRKNQELEEMSKGVNIVKWIKGQISWLGHLEIMEEDRIPKKIFTLEMEGLKKKGKNQERMEIGSRKRSSSAGSEKTESVVGRYENMEGHCSTGQSPQWAVVPMEEEEYNNIY